MKSILNIILVVAVLVLSAGCTRNNGDIGKLFGQWQLMSMEREGETVPDYQGNVYWSFQNTTIEMKEVVGGHEYYQSFGNFRVSDNTLFLSFPDKDFKPNPITGLERESALQIIKLTGGEMILGYGDPATIYRFRKW